MKLFGTDGVRGEAGRELDVNKVLTLAMAAGVYFRKHSHSNKILVGKDTRRSGYMIENAIVAGLTAVGYDVIQIGPMPTPAISFLTEDMRCDAGIVISASHNPYYDNGIKFFDTHGNKLNGGVEAEIEKIFYDGSEIAENQKSAKEIGCSKRIDDVIGRYIVHIKNSFPKSLTLKGLRIVVDAANGAAYKCAPTILSELGADLIVINDEPNGYNINENCGALHPEALSEAVAKYRADIGFALDGDADRVVVVDENGEMVDGDLLLGALAVYLDSQKNLQNNGVAVTIMSNTALDEFLGKKGIKTYRTDVGDKNVFEAMQKEGLNFGGEQSGHIIFSDYVKTGDSLVSTLQTLAYLITSKKKASEALRPFKLYPQLLDAVNVKSKKPLKDIAGLDEKLKEVEKEKIHHLLRYSGTENKLRIMLEGESEKKLQKAMDELLKFLRVSLADGV